MGPSGYASCMNRRQYAFVMWVVERWWASVLISLVAVAVGVGIILNPDEAGYRGTDTTWMKYTIAPVCILGGIAGVAAAVYRKVAGPRGER